MTATKHTKSRSRLSALFLTIILTLTVFSPEALQVFAAELPDVQEPTEVLTDELQYQTITAQLGEADTELVTLDGLMPVNAEVSVQSSPDYAGDNLFAYNISITDRNGSQFQPGNGEPIKVEIANTAISDAQDANQKLRLWHIDDNGLREEIKDFKVKDGKIIFEASGFSVYEVDNGTPALRTYKFMMPSDPQNNSDYSPYYYETNSQYADGSYKKICSQTIKNNEKLIFPQLPADIDSKYTFIGWFVGGPNGSELDFNDIPPVTTTETVELYAVFESCVYAIFHEQYNGRTDSFPIFATRRGKLVSDENGILKATFEYDDLKVMYDDEEKEEGAPPSMQFVGWTTEKIKDYTTGQTAVNLPSPHTFTIEEELINEDPEVKVIQPVRLYPIFEPIRWLEFESNGSGATYIPPKSFPKQDGTVLTNNIPTRAGYVFDGWFTEADGGNCIADRNQNLIDGVNTDTLQVRDGKLFVRDPNITAKLYAHWKPSNSKYTIIIWKQKATDSSGLSNSDKSYDFSESIVVDALTESTASVANKYKQFAIKNNANYNSEYQGFQYSRCSAATTVSGDGKTVLNVYYDRNAHTFTFKVNRKTVYDFTELYGADIKNRFPITDYENYIWTDSGNPQLYTEVLATLERMPDADVTFTGTTRTPNETIYYYVEIDEEDAAEYTQTYEFNSRLYGLYKTVRHGFYYLTYGEEYHPIEGYIRNRDWAIPYFGERGRSSYNNSDITDSNRAPIGGFTSNRTTERNINYLFYNRDTYTIEFADSSNNNLISQADVLFQQKIESSVPPPPTPPEGYRFTGWYTDAACSTRVFFHEPTQAEIAEITDKDGNIAPYQVYERMPATNLRLYAGWDTIWFRIEIDPNGGEISSTQSTFFWEPYNGDPIEEYLTATRNYEADVNGTYYYAKHDRAYHGLGDEWEEREDNIPNSERGAFYTEDITQATSATRYRHAASAYRYVGWYEVDPVTGAETPYKFGEPVMHDTYLRLHWKQLGTYYIDYDAGEGTLDGADQNETTFLYLDDENYADRADVVVTRVAHPVEGKNFIGWTVKNDPSGQVYYPGQSFRFSSEFAESISQINAETGSVEVKRTIILEAVYGQIETAKIIYDANGGAITDSESAVLPANAGGQVISDAPFPVDDPALYQKISVEYSTTETQLTVSDLLNNSAVKLSNGTGFYNHGYKFLGWSPKKDGSENFYDKASITTTNHWVDDNQPLILYAQWEVPVYFDRNDVTDTNSYHWGNGTGNDWADDNNYTYDAEKGMYYTVIKLNGKTDKPDYTPTSSDPEEVFSHWSLEKQNAAGVMNEPFDFSTAITQELIDSQQNDGDYLVLHACWRAPIRIPVYYVDTSKEDWIRKDDWRKDGDGANIVLRDNTHISLAGRAEADSYAKDNKTDGYAYAFATKAGTGDTDYNTITDAVQITEIWYDSDEMCVKAKYSDNTEHEFDAANEAIYLVYYKSPDEIDVKYDVMDLDGSLSTVNVSNAAPKKASVVPEPPYSMNSNLKKPLAWANNQYSFYSFAVGKTDAASSADLKVITGYKISDTDRPQLQVRNNWNGFEYSFDGENWHNCGYDIALYSIYYEQLPTIVTLTEETIALPDKMGTEFDYTITITQTEETRVTRTFEYYYYGQWVNLNTGNYRTTEFDPTYSTSEVSTITVSLSNDQSDSYVLFFASPAPTVTYRTPYEVNGVQMTYTSNRRDYNVYYQDTTNQQIYQTISITQTPNAEFTTTNDAAASNDWNVYHSSYTASENGDPVTITYTNRQILKKAVNVALRGNSGITPHNELRTDDESVYLHDFTNSALWKVSDSAVISPAELIDNNSDYIFLGIISGTEEAGKITQEQPSVTSLSFGELTPGVYGYYLNGDQTKTLDDQEIWFVYAKKPPIKYLYEKPDGTFEEITEFKRNDAAFTRSDIAQNEVLPISSNGLLISQISTPGAPAFLIPGDLDYQNDLLRLDLNRLSIGNASGIITDSDSESMQITIADGNLQYQFHDTDTPEIFEEDAVVYAVYKIKGYELTLTKQVLGSSEGTDTFTFVISSDQLTYSKYDTSKGQVTVSGNTISLTVQRGESVTVYGLLSGEYTVEETTAGDYEMSAKVNGLDAKVTENKVAAAVNGNTRVDVVNTYPIPVTGTGTQSAPYVIFVMILATAAFVFICRRKGEKQDDCSSL